MLKCLVVDQCTQIHNKKNISRHVCMILNLHTLTPCVTFFCVEASWCRSCYQRGLPRLVFVVLAELISNIQHYVL